MATDANLITGAVGIISAMSGGAITAAIAKHFVLKHFGDVADLTKAVSKVETTCAVMTEKFEKFEGMHEMLIEHDRQIVRIETKINVNK